MKLYHYTVRHDTHLGGILRDGIIDIEDKRYGSGYHPFFPSAVWFSQRSDYEPTAVKFAVYNDGCQRRMSVEQYLSEAARFTIDTDKVPVLNWYGFSRYAVGRPSLSKRQRGLVAELIQGMERIGRKWDGSPDDWYCSLVPVPLEKAETLEVCRNNEWKPIPYSRSQQVATN